MKLLQGNFCFGRLTHEDGAQEGAALRHSHLLNSSVTSQEEGKWWDRRSLRETWASHGGGCMDRHPLRLVTWRCWSIARLFQQSSESACYDTSTVDFLIWRKFAVLNIISRYNTSRISVQCSSSCYMRADVRSDTAKATCELLLGKRQTWKMSRQETVM